MSKASKTSKKQPEGENVDIPLADDPEQYSPISFDTIDFLEGQTEETPLKIRYCVVPIKSLHILSAEENARFMTADQMRRLTDNIKRDKAMTSVVLVYPDFQEKKLIVISGNHRVEASAAAGTKMIPALVIQSHLTVEHRLALQLSHNAVTGQDDPNTLLRIYEALSMEYKSYSGLTDDSFNVLEKLNIDSLAIGTPQYEEIILQFLPDEKEAFIEHLERLGKAAEKKTYLMAEYDDYLRLFRTIVAVKEFKNVFNSAVAIRELADLAIERLEQLKAEAEIIKEETGENQNDKKNVNLHLRKLNLPYVKPEDCNISQR